jgi:hypothetical protein
MVSKDDIKNVQRLLVSLKHEITVDGVWGPNTSKALLDALGSSSTPLIASYKDLSKLLGEPGSALASSGRCVLPTRFKLAWSETTYITSFACHKSVEDVLTKIFSEAFAYYGATEFDHLRLNVFGGCYNDRNMTSGNKKSVHAWGAAVDIDPSNNQYAWGKDKATLARPEYDEWWNIVERSGGVSLGRAINKDWMHFQLCGV